MYTLSLHDALPISVAKKEVLVAQDKYYPFSELLDTLQDRVEANPKLGGCLVEDAYYAANENDFSKIELILRGRIATETKREELEITCGRLMRSVPGWVQEEVLLKGEVPLKAVSFQQIDPAPELDPKKVNLAVSPKAQFVQVVPPSYSTGLTLFEEGLRHFWKSKYAEAARTFQMAVIESPETIEFRYWRIVAELSRGNQERATWIMQSAVGMPGYLDSIKTNRSLNKSLQRVQGSLRAKLIYMQTQAVFARSSQR